MFVVDLRQIVAIRNGSDIKAPDGWKIAAKFGTSFIPVKFRGQNLSRSNV